MTMESFEKEPETITDDWVLNNLKKRLAEIESDLARAKKVEDVDTTGEDDVEQREQENEDAPLKELLETEKDLTKAKIEWVKKHGDACIEPDCRNKVPAGRRKYFGVACSDHMDNEEQYLKDLPLRS